MRTASVCARQPGLAPSKCRRRVAPSRSCPARARPVVAAANNKGLLRSLETALTDAEARVGQWIAELGGEAAGAATRLQNCLLGLLLVLHRVVRFVQLAAMALQLQLGAQQQLSYATAGYGAPGGSNSADSGTPAAFPSSSSEQGEQGQAAAAAAAAGNVMDFLSAATTGAVEQLRHTLTDATEGIETKWSCIERTASELQGTLFEAAQAHAEAMRSNPQGGMWKQPNVEAVLSEEEKLREAVFAQVYAELLQKDNKSISFQAQQQ